MTSARRIEANRRNALKSTGPRTEAGKQASRCNAVRHGLTAETVIGALEGAEDYQAFEVAIIADYDAQSAVERELVLRLASLRGGCAAPRPWKPACSKSRLTICASSGRPAKFTHSPGKLSARCLNHRAQLVSTGSQHRTASPTQQNSYPTRGRNPP